MPPQLRPLTLLAIVLACHTTQAQPPRNRIEKKDSTRRYNIVVLPSAGYTLQTGWAALISSNIVFRTGSPTDTAQKFSFINTSITGTIRKQLIVPVQASIWSKNKNWNWITDLRAMLYPSVTYGLGINTLRKDEREIKYTYLKVHQTLLRSVNKNLFAGVGFFYDHYTRVIQVDKLPGQLTPFDQYGFFNESTTAGPIFRLLFDDRKNPVTPKDGWYVNSLYRNNFSAKAGETRSSFFLLEYRRYLAIPRYTKNTIAIWNYYNLTLTGNPFYLMLPSTGWDENYNTGRGYIQGRFRDRQMAYAETEYRFSLTKNEKLGGVIFINTSSFARQISALFNKFAYGYGLGARIQLNKNSKTNLCVDYAWGKEHSRGIFVNIGEVF